MLAEMTSFISIQCGILSLATVSAALGSPAPSSNHNYTGLASSQILNDPYPYAFPQQGLRGSNLFPMPLCKGLKLEEATIDQLQHWMSLGRLSTRKLVECYMDRITQTDGYIR